MCRNIKSEAGYLGFQEARSTKIIRRQQLLERISLACNRKAPVLIQAGPGFGKTTLVAQWAQEEQRSVIWLNLKVDDQDPLVLLNRLKARVHGLVPGLDLSELEQLIQAGEVSPMDPMTPLELLVGKIKKQAAYGLVLFIDDIQNLSGKKWAVHWLNTLLEVVANHVPQILATRIPLEDVLGDHNPIESHEKIDEDHLRFGLDDLIEFGRGVLHQEFSAEQARRLYQRTGGWPISIESEAHSLINGEASQQPTNLCDRVLSCLTSKEAEVLLWSSVLSAIPIDAIENVIPVKGADAVLDSIIKKVSLVQKYREESEYSVHPVLREQLEVLAEEKFGADVWGEHQNRIGEYYRSIGDVFSSLKALLRAGNISSALTVFLENGLKLYQQGYYVQLKVFLDSLPVNIRNQNPWVSLLHGAVQLEIEPVDAESSLLQAKLLFEQEKDTLGELLSLSFLIFYSGSVKGQYEANRELFARALKLYEDLVPDLGPEYKIVVLPALAAAWMFLDADYQKSTSALDEAIRLARSGGLLNRKIRMLYLRFYGYLASGRLDDGLREIEYLAQIGLRPGVDKINRTFIFCAQQNWLVMNGDLDLFENELHRSIINPEQYVQESVMMAFVYRWQSDVLLARGKHTETVSLCRKILESPLIFHSDHMASQFLQNMAVAKAMLGNHSEAEELALKAYERRQAAGEIHQVTYNNLAVGITFLVNGKLDEAESFLRKAEDLARYCNKSYALASACFYLSLLGVRYGDQEAVRRYMDEFALAVGAQDFFYLLIPALLEELASAVVPGDIQSTLIRRISSRYLKCDIDNQGNSVPTLEIRLQQSISLSINGEEIINCKDLTQNQRNLLALLVSHPQQQVPQSEIQNALWVDIPPKKSRARFDTLLRRLRKVLEDQAGKQAVDHYLVLEKGIISLNSCEVDAWKFQRLAKDGLTALSKGLKWRASVLLENACLSWKGKLMPGVGGFYSVANFRNELQDLFIRCVLELVKLKKDEARRQDAARILDHAFSIDADDERLLKERFHLYRQAGEHRQATQLIAEFEIRMREEGYSENEISDMVWSIREPG